MDLKLKDKVALVTGGSKGLGRASALALAREGCHIALTARSAEDLEEARAEVAGLGVEVVALPADYTKAEEIQGTVTSTVEHFRRLDILVNCAGGAAAGSLFDVTDDEWEEGFQLKVLGYIRATRAVVPIMERQGWGRIIMISGTAGKQPAPYSLAIGAFNATINNFSRSLADQLASKNIGVVSVSPGPTRTERWNNLKAATARLKGVAMGEAEWGLLQGIPWGRIAEPDEIGNAVAYLASPLAEYITGVNVVIDGGAVKVI